MQPAFPDFAHWSSARGAGLVTDKAGTPYEFWVKVSVVTTLKEGLVVGVRSMPGNPYDGHTLDEALEQAEILSEVKPEPVTLAILRLDLNRHSVA